MDACFTDNTGGHLASRCSSLTLSTFCSGRTYTSFEYANLQVSPNVLRGRIEISADITNTGTRPGRELVQLYVRGLSGPLARPVRELKGFRHVELQPGETRRVACILREEDLAFTCADGTRGVEPGEFHVWIVPRSQSGLRGAFRIWAARPQPPACLQKHQDRTSGQVLMLPAPMRDSVLIATILCPNVGQPTA